MKGNFGSLGIFVVFCLLLPTPVLAANSGAFLRVGVGARALGMGGAFVALVDDATGVYWNPAGLSQLESREIASMYTNQFGLNCHYSFLAYGQSLGGAKSLGIGLVSLSLGQIPITGVDERGRPVIIGYANCSENALLVSYSQPLLKIPLGLTIKGIRQVLADESSIGFGFDFGTKIILFEKFSLGAVVRTGFVTWTTGEREAFPTQVIVGIAYYPIAKLVLAFDIGWQRDLGPEIHAGGEYWLVPQLALRAGWDKGSLTGGIGVLIGKFKLDYAFMLHNLGFSHRLSLGVEF